MSVVKITIVFFFLEDRTKTHAVNSCPGFKASPERPPKPAILTYCRCFGFQICPAMQEKLQKIKKSW